MTSTPQRPATRGRNRLLRALPTVVSLVAITAVVLVATRASDPASPVDLRYTDPAEREAAPTASAPLLTGDGQRGLDDYRGRIVVLNFWASWCGPCRAEQPELNAAHAALPDDVAFLGVAVQDSEANALAHWREFDVAYDSLFDRTTRWSAQFEGVGPRAVPTTILIDPEGRVAGRIFGETTQAELVSAVMRIRQDG